MRAKLCSKAVLLVLSMLFTGHAVPADESDEADDLVAGTERCISTSQLRRTDIIDDRTILFYMRGNEIYLNQLPNRCSGLRSADRFSYSPTGNRLCNFDSITPLRDAGPGGLGMRGGVSCGLGNFKAITEDDVLVLKNKDAPDTEMQEDPAEIEPLDEDAADEPAEIESIE